jgi:hypothetical protein
MRDLIHTMATGPCLVRRNIELHRSWIERKLGIPLSDLVVFQTDISLAEAAIPHCIGYTDPGAATSKALKLLRDQVESAEIPPNNLPISN